MTNTRPDPSLSRLELVVLARLSSSKPPTEIAIAKSVADLALPNKAADASKIVSNTIAELRRRGLVHAQRNTMTDHGSRALRSAFGLDKTPAWSEIHTTYLLGHALGLTLGPSTKGELKDVSLVARAFLRAHLGVTEAGEIADKLIADALAMPAGPMTLARIRAHMLARHAGVTSAATPKQVALSFVSKTVGQDCLDKRTMSHAVIRRWIYAVTPSNEAIVSTTPRALPAQSTLPLHPMTAKAATSPGTSIAPPVVQPTPPILKGTPPPPRPPVTSADTLLTLVRDAIPRIGADGRFGAEKVFVSALWHRIERDGRPADLSFDRFKNWLIIANRDQLLDLARADLLGSMDPKLVAESEIEDLGAIFHFVVDSRASASGRGIHAR